jgi:multidrug efflux pump subunit AcrA (membrane-fusion protein)
MNSSPSGRKKAAAAALAVGVFAVVDHGKGAEAAPAASVRTVAVEKADLSNTQSFTGTLGFGTPQPRAR